MSKMILVSKQFLADTFGLSYLVEGSCSVGSLKIVEKLAPSYEFNEDDCDEVDSVKPDVSSVEQPYGYNHPTLESAFADLLIKQADYGRNEISRFDAEKQKFGNQVLLFRHAKGWLPAKRMQSMTAKLNKIEQLKESAKSTPALADCLVSLENEYLIMDGFIKPNQTCYVFEQAHSLHFSSSVCEVKAVKVGVNAISSKHDVAKVYMSVELVNIEKEKRFYMHWSDFSGFNGDYFKTGTTGQYVFTDKEKCLAFAKAMLNKDIQKLQDNMNALTL